MRIENRIKRWRDEDPADETEHHVELLCDAEEEIRRLRELIASMGNVLTKAEVCYRRGWKEPLLSLLGQGVALEQARKEMGR